VAEAPPQPLSVVIPTHERCQAVARALRSLAVQTASPSTYEVVVSIDGSTDGTREMVASLATPYPLVVADSPWRGRAAACNAALALVRGDVVIVLDDDMEATPEFIERHRAHHPPGSRQCVMGAVPVRISERSPLAARYVAAKFGAHLATIARPGHAFVPRDFYSGNTSLRTEVLEEVGGFDESFRLYGNEDVDLGLRLRAAGVTLRYEPAALAYQEYAKDLRQLARDTLAKGSTSVSLARGHPDVFEALRLADPLDASRPWLAARAMLLALTRRRRGTPDPLFVVAQALERVGLWRQPLFYRALLDYAFWAGVDAALSNCPDQGELARLAAELHRGPIDLLLHR
jgi:glycosyltransferase involved in cell wall biosynthesis